MKVLILVGPTGTGKSYEALRMYPEAYRAPWPTGGRWWWPEYEGQKAVICDEFRHQVKIDAWMRLFDRYAMWTEYKGDNLPMVSEIVVITTNLEVSDWYPKTPHDSVGKKALERRIQEFAEIWDFSSPARDLFTRRPVVTKRRRRGVFKFAPIKEVAFGVPIV